MTVKELYEQALALGMEDALIGEFNTVEWIRKGDINWLDEVETHDRVELSWELK